MPNVNDSGTKLAGLPLVPPPVPNLVAAHYSALLESFFARDWEHTSRRLCIQEANVTYSSRGEIMTSNRKLEASRQGSNARSRLAYTIEASVQGFRWWRRPSRIWSPSNPKQYTLHPKP